MADAPARSHPADDGASSPVAPDTSAPDRLPRGRHHLTREEVVGSQRSRILRAMAEAVSESGYVVTSVADVLRRARVSRATFYEQFSSKEDCFAAAYDTAIEVLLKRMRSVSPPAASAEAGRGDPSRFEGVLVAYLDSLAAEPEFARVFLIEVYAAGPTVLARRGKTQQSVVDLVAREVGARDPDERFACEALVAAVIGMVTSRLAADDLAGLRDLREPIVRLVGRVAGAFGG